jgi:hypothetical protein
MHFSSLVSSALLAASAAAAPVKQHPLIHEKSPYYKDFKDPYDHKIDAVGDKLQPLPIVSINRPLMRILLTNCRAMGRIEAQICWAHETRPARGRTRIWFDRQRQTTAQ